MIRRQWGEDRRRLICASCGATLGAGYVSPADGRLIVLDPDDAAIEPMRGADVLRAAQAQVRRLAAASEVIDLDHARRAEDPDGWARESAAARTAVQAAIAEVGRLRGDSAAITYQFRCDCRATPRRTAENLAKSIRDTPGEALRL